MSTSWTIALFVALGIGALVGLERQQSESAGTFAGIRTFSLFALLGAVTQLFFPTLLPIVLGMVLLLVAIGYVGKLVLEKDAGMTTAVAAILTFVFGAMATHSDEGLTFAIVLGTVTTALLAVKEPVHAYTARIGRKELRNTLKFLIVALVVLPLLPDQELDVLLGLNPRFVWLMVVFVSGLGFLGYVFTRLLGPKKGIGLTGLLGGFVSSTATTVAMAEQSRRNAELTRVCALATVFASIAMFPRVLILVAVVHPALVTQLVIPLGAMTIVGSLLAGVILLQLQSDRSPTVDLDNPFRVRPALVFGALFAVVLLALDLLADLLGDVGVYATAVLSGTVDANAITLSLSKLALDGDVVGTVAVTGIILAVVVNTVVKIVIAWTLGTPGLGRIVGTVLGVTSAIGLAIVWLV